MLTTYNVGSNPVVGKFEFRALMEVQVFFQIRDTERMMVRNSLSSDNS